MPETIDLLLKELKLPAFIRHQQQAIEKGDGHVRYLLGLCEQEAADRYQKAGAKVNERIELTARKKLCQSCLTELNTSVQQQVIGLKDQTDWVQCA